MYKLKDAATRGAALLGAVGLLIGLGASTIPAFMPVASADALNPLTDRSLTLSSSAPGWDDNDGSGNITYAPPDSGPDGEQTGETFQFNVSTDSSSDTPNINGFSFQYCIAAAGSCEAPGDDAYIGSGPGHYTGRGSDTATTADLNVVTGSGAGAPAEVSSATYGYITSSPRDDTCYDATGISNIPTTEVSANQTDCEYTGTPATTGTDSFPGVPAMDNTEGNFVVLTKDAGAGSWTYNGGWTMTASNLEDGSVPNGTATGKNNYITLLNTQTGGGVDLHSGGAVKVIFYANKDNYITNPGSDAFFVKINDYNDAEASAAPGDLLPTDYQYGSANCAANTACIVDGGVTVANVMNQSIEIQTKVLETMDFSVGTVDPDTLSNAQLDTATGLSSPGECDPILTSINPTAADATPNVLTMGNQLAENSLETGFSFATHSYFRLSSNSSAGATVYYSGVTLSNTEGNQIAPDGDTAQQPHIGTEQFGLALDNGASGAYPVDYTQPAADSNPDESGVLFENGADLAAQGYTDLSAQGGLSNDWTTYESGSNGAAHNPQLAPLVPAAQYGGGGGYINAYEGTIGSAFAFDANANTIPVPIASESDQVVNCVTGKVRYLANIAATTAAGIYTTAINYIAAPQY